MKNYLSLRSFWQTINIVALALFVTFVLVSCGGEEEIGPIPVVSVSSNALSGLPGATVTGTVTVVAPEGGRTLNILVNGAPSPNFPSVPMNGQTNFTWDFSFRIPTDSREGSITNFSFIAIDQRDRPSIDIAVIAVTTNAIPPKPIIEVSGTITTNTTWTANNIYRLNGFVRVGNDPALNVVPAKDSGPTLTIQPGTVIIGDRETKGTLIIQRGAKINAIGTAQNPIVMTSERPIGQREPGDWGGLVICGRASNNQPSGLFELEGGYGGFSGGGATPDDNDNSGVVRYVRIEYAGVPINPNQEVNTLTMGAVGRATQIDYVMASYGLDDAFEWFGGTNNSKYLIAYKGLDDDFDVDFGWTGFVQYGIGIRAPTLADQSGSNGFEVDNNAQGSLVVPFTEGIFSNITIIGPKANRNTAISLQFQSAAQLRRSNKLKIHNSFFTGYPNGIFIDGTNTVAFAASGELVMRNNVLAGVEHWGGNGFGSAGSIFTGAPSNGANHPNAPRGFRVGAGTATFSNGIFALTPLQIGGVDAEAWFLANNNQILPRWQDAGIAESVFASVNPQLRPNAGSILLQGASFTGLPTFFDRVTFRGAFGTTDWTAGWAEWAPELRDYSR